MSAVVANLVLVLSQIHKMVDKIVRHLSRNPMASRPWIAWVSHLGFAVTLVLTQTSCGSSSSGFASLATDDSTEADPAGATDDPELFTSVVAEAFTVSCGRTSEAPANFTQDGSLALGCVVLDATEKTKTTESVSNLTMVLTLNDTTTLTLQDEAAAEENAESTEELLNGPKRTPLLILATSSTRWHYFFQISTDEWSRVQAIESHVTVKGAPFVKVDTDPQSYDPEGLSGS